MHHRGGLGSAVLLLQHAHRSAGTAPARALQSTHNQPPTINTHPTTTTTTTPLFHSSTLIGVQVQSTHDHHPSTQSSRHPLSHLPIHQSIFQSIYQLHHPRPAYSTPPNPIHPSTHQSIHSSINQSIYQLAVNGLRSYAMNCGGGGLGKWWWFVIPRSWSVHLLVFYFLSPQADQRVLRQLIVSYLARIDEKLKEHDIGELHSVSINVVELLVSYIIEILYSNRWRRVVFHVFAY